MLASPVRPTWTYEEHATFSKLPFGIESHSRDHATLDNQVCRDGLAVRAGGLGQNNACDGQNAPGVHVNNLHAGVDALAADSA